MGRRTSKQELIDIVGKLRREIPDIVLRTTLITGFPGETEEDHEELKEFVDEMEFDRLVSSLTLRRKIPRQQRWQTRFRKK